MMKPIITAIIIIFAISICKAQDEGYIQTAYNAIMAGDHAMAAEYYSKAIEAHNTYAPSYYGRGLAYSYQNKLEESVFDFSKAVELDPKYHEAFYARGLSYIKLGQYPKAVSDFKSAIQMKDIFSAYFYALANAYSLMGANDSALVNYDKSLEIDPENGLAYYGRGVVHKLDGRYESALKDFEIYLKKRDNQDNLKAEVNRLINEIITREED